MGLDFYCTPCPCHGSSCQMLPDETIMCFDCPNGYTGRLCDQCDNGYFDKPNETIGEFTLNCQLCDCNGNSDISNPMSCDRITGRHRSFNYM